MRLTTCAAMSAIRPALKPSRSRTASKTALPEIAGALACELRESSHPGLDPWRRRPLRQSVGEVRSRTRELLRMDAREVLRGRTLGDVVRKQLALGRQRPHLLRVSLERVPVDR